MTVTTKHCPCNGSGAIAHGDLLEICGCPAQDTREQVIAELRAERAELTNPFDRIAFDNQRDARLPGLPVGLWLLAFEDEP